MPETVPNELVLAEDTISSSTSHTLAAVGTVTRKSVVALTGGVLSQGLKFIVYLYVARAFSSSDFGSIAFANAINGFVYVISQFGLPIFGSREIARNRTVDRNLLLAVACCRAALAVLGTGAALIFLLLSPGVTNRDYALVAFFGLSNVPLASFFDWVFQGLNRQGASAAMNVVWQFFWLSFTYVGTQLWSNILVVPVAMCAAAVFASALGLVWLRFSRVFKPAKGDVSASFRRVWSTLKTGRSLGTGAILLNILVWTDTITVRLLLGEQAAGWYAAGNRVALAVSMLSNYYMWGAFPLLCSTSRSNLDAFQQYFQRAYDELGLLFLPGSVWGLFYAPQVILFLFKRQEYLAGVPVFRLFQIILPLIVINLLFGMGIVLAFHEDRVYRKILAIAVGVLVILCPIFTKLYGIEGAACATLLAYVISVLLFYLKSRHLVQFKHRDALLGPGLVGLAAALAGKVFHAKLLLAVGLLILAYAILFLRQNRRLRDKTASSIPRG